MVEMTGYWDLKRVNETFLEAVKTGSIKEVLKWLPKAGVNTIDDFGMTALHRAALRGSPDIVELLLKRGADPNTLRPRTGETALHFACREYEKAVEKPREENEMKTRLPSVADREAVIRLLIKHKAVINAQDNHGESPLKIIKEEKLKQFLEIEARKNNAIIFRKKNKE
ncbi:ankyrin repeat domain-containing protein [Candidatus Micrarchaeota archaeon]|nr:ankyrin repeat domain-containing protein [Candidatus Micrarchaeota archaeon]